MRESKPTLSDQIKEAERDKLIAEKDKLQYDLQQSKKFFTKNTFWTIVVAVTVFGFYYEFAAKPLIERDTILGSLDNAKTKLELDKKSKRIFQDSLGNRALKEKLDQEHIKVIRTADTLNSARLRIAKADSAIASFTKLLNSNPTKADLLIAQSKVSSSLKQINRYRSKVDSLQRKSYNNFVLVDVHFIYKNEDFPPVPEFYLSLDLNPVQHILFPSFRVSGGHCYIYVFPDETYNLTLNSDKYKLRDGVFQLKSLKNGKDGQQYNVTMVDN